jgi:hypothetical protein
MVAQVLLPLQYTHYDSELSSAHVCKHATLYVRL